jgi:phosphohistidine phosphatase
MIPSASPRIYLLRHASSAWAQPGERDFGRPLDAEGFVEADAVARWAAGRGYRPERMISSTALRCRQTADVVQRAFDKALPLMLVDELYNAPVETYLDIIANNSEVASLMLVGHNPSIEEVLEKLIGADESARAIPTGYPTAGLAVLDRPDDDSPFWHLADFLTG